MSLKALTMTIFDVITGRRARQMKADDLKAMREKHDEVKEKQHHAATRLHVLEWEAYGGRHNETRERK